DDAPLCAPRSRRAPLRAAAMHRPRSRRTAHAREDAQESRGPCGRGGLVAGKSGTWIDNLETGSGLQLDDPDHADFVKPYVQNYIAQFGARKAAATALGVAPQTGRRPCRDAILRHTPADAPAEHQRKLDRVRLQLRRAIRKQLP